MVKKTRLQRPRPAKAERVKGDKLPLIEHLHELRRRLFYVAACVAVGSAIAYGFEQKLIDILLRPSNGQHFIYTSPLGGMNFLFSVCVDLGLVVATPVIIYQLLAFLQPLMKDTTRRFVLGASAAIGFVALCGVVFGYFLGLPSALHFLLHQFTSVQVRPLLTIQAYMQFVSLYLLGSALMFQLPLILLCINRMKPLKPSGLFKYERHLIAGSFIVAFIMNPTPNIIGQLVVVVPMIITYQLGIGVIWLVNRGKKLSLVQQLREQDTLRQAERAVRRLELTPFFTPAPAFAASTDMAAGTTMPLPTPVAVEPIPVPPPAPESDLPPAPSPAPVPPPPPAPLPTLAPAPRPIPIAEPQPKPEVKRTIVVAESVETESAVKVEPIAEPAKEKTPVVVKAKAAPKAKTTKAKKPKAKAASAAKPQAKPKAKAAAKVAPATPTPPPESQVDRIPVRVVERRRYVSNLGSAARGSYVPSLRGSLIQ